MRQDIFENIYKGISIPVIVCEDNEDMTVSFANTEAYLLLHPTLAVERLGADNPSCLSLRQIMRFSNESDYDNFRQTLKNTGSLDWYSTALISAENTTIAVTLAANIASHEGYGYTVIYLFHDERKDKLDDENDILAVVLNTTYHATDINQAVQSILASVGEHIGTDRVYVFEDLFNNHMRNTYEWCAPGVEPVIQDLQNLNKNDYNHDTIVNPSGMYITDDVSTLPEKDRAVLEPQGIKSLAILPLFHHDEPIGYIGYDDCQNTRKWSCGELTLLKGISSIVSSLIIRRNAEAEIRHSHEALQTISDNIGAIIYVNDIKTYELKFVNRTLAALLGVEPDQLINRPCWQVLQKDMDGPCPFCPIPKLLNTDDDPCGAAIEWEHQNTITGGWFWVKDSIIRWTDGNLMHFEAAIDITLRRQYEEQLQHYASTDTMTGVFNREWGTKLLQKEHERSRVTGIPMSLCFIDLDGLKRINDIFGHNTGDAAILDVCKAIRRNVRKDDIVCRWGGDEFVLLIKCVLGRADAIMRNIQANLASNDAKNGTHPSLAFSYGLSDFISADTVEAAIAMADGLMYSNKKAKHAAR